jgi:hypothetical protein
MAWTVFIYVSRLLMFQYEISPMYDLHFACIFTYVVISIIIK